MINWINVTDVLPPKYECVLLRCKGYKVPAIVGYLMSGDESRTALYIAPHIVDNSKDEYLTDVTHWAEITMSGQ